MAVCRWRVSYGPPGLPVAAKLTCWLVLGAWSIAVQRLSWPSAKVRPSTSNSSEKTSDSTRPSRSLVAEHASSGVSTSTHSRSKQSDTGSEGGVGGESGGVGGKGGKGGGGEGGGMDGDGQSEQLFPGMVPL
eukprot:scaffold27875_cov67-Phaeocystis_antarctica.AAC.3